MKPVEKVLEHLEGVQYNGSGWKARCPAHADRNPSLAISEGDAGRVLLNCFAGCPKEDILEAAGLRWRDLYPSETRNGHHKRRSWEVKNAAGQVVSVHHRRDTANGKSVWWRGPNGEKTLQETGLKLTDLPLYRSEEAGSFPEDVPVVVVEGEPAADALSNLYPATLGTTTGAETAPGPEALEVLRGRPVVLWPDNDEPGRRHMERVAERLEGVACEARVFTWKDAPPKGDAADHPAVKSGNRAEVKALIAEWAASPVSLPSPSLIGTVTAVTPVRFAEMAPPGPREYLVAGLLPKGYVTTLFGDGGSAKSVLAMSLATALAGEAGEWLGRKVSTCPVLFVDFELDAQEQRRRAFQVACGRYLEKPPRDLFYVCGLGQSTGEVLSGCLGICEREGVGLVIVDSLGIALQGEAESAADVIRFHREYLEPFRAAGVTVLAIDHQAKGGGERYQAKRTFGSVYKENLSRSVLQVEPDAHAEGSLTLKARQTKSSFGSKAEPFGVHLTFSEEKIIVEARDLDATDLAAESTLNAADRVLFVLKEGPAFPADIAEACHLSLGTVKNCLSRLRKSGRAENTGRVEGQSKEVRITGVGQGVISVIPPVEGDGNYTSEHPVGDRFEGDED